MNDKAPVNFVRFDAETGDILCSGSTDIGALQKQIDAGEPVLIADGNFLTDRVDLKTKKIKPRRSALPSGGKDDHVPVRAGRGWQAF